MINPQAYPQRKNVAASPVIEPGLRHDPNTGMHKHVIPNFGKRCPWSQSVDWRIYWIRTP